MPEVIGAFLPAGCGHKRAYPAREARKNQSMASNAVIKNGLVLLSLARRKRDIGAAAWRGDRM